MTDWRIQRSTIFKRVIFIDENNKEYRPDEIVYDAFTAADLVHAWAMEKDRTDYQRKIAREFLSYWPEGPQLSKRRPSPDDTISQSFRISKKLYDQIPGTKSHFIVDAIEEKLRREEYS